MKNRPARAIMTAAKAILTALLAACFAFTCLLTAAEAQERPRRTLLQMLFGRYEPDIPEQQPAPRRTFRPPRKRIAPPPRQVVVQQPEAPPEIRKLPDAKTILVVGDFLAGGLGDGLGAAFSTSPGVVVQTRSTVASGLVRQDYYNWPQQLPTMMDQLKPAMVVVMIGANDRQQMTGDGLNEKFGTDPWFLAYEERVQQFGKLVTSRHIPLLWVGLPPFGSDQMTADAVKLNQLYQSQVESIGGEFIDIWDGFTDQNGEFIVTGSDINGQQVRLRTSDGINLTAAGKRKVAFYVEKPTRRLLGDQASPDITRLDTGNQLPAEQVNLPPAELEKITRTQPVSLSDPNLDGGAQLLGGGPARTSVTESPRDLLVKKGQMAPAPTGRVDDYRLPTAATTP
ncbi:SGNH/GDSL hydrolase family protein [Rhizobium sp. BR 362]|uniref:SGNH/GDSL hydrolase family protein n=1 Tax=Rhizobium sp. BR 362 TaxID=3040670 RepID=UPI002F3E68F7